MNYPEMETIFMQKYQDAYSDTDKIRYLRFFNHIAALRNKLEFNSEHNTE